MAIAVNEANLSKEGRAVYCPLIIRVLSSLMCSRKLNNSVTHHTTAPRELKANSLLSPGVRPMGSIAAKHSHQKNLGLNYDMMISYPEIFSVYRLEIKLQKTLIINNSRWKNKRNVLLINI